jgi:hypothetical protein
VQKTIARCQLSVVTVTVSLGVNPRRASGAPQSVAIEIIRAGPSCDETRHRTSCRGTSTGDVFQPPPARGRQWLWERGESSSRVKNLMQAHIVAIAAL